MLNLPLDPRARRGHRANPIAAHWRLRQLAALPPSALLLLGALTVGGCAPDAWRSDAPYEDFLNRVQARCLYQRIGSAEINQDFMQDPYFLDLSSRFYHGAISQQAFVENLQGAYEAKPDSPGVRCLLGQMPPPPAVAGPSEMAPSR